MSSTPVYQAGFFMATAASNDTPPLLFSPANSESLITKVVLSSFDSTNVPIVDLFLRTGTTFSIATVARNTGTGVVEELLASDLGHISINPTTGLFVMPILNNTYSGVIRNNLSQAFGTVSFNNNMSDATTISLYPIDVTSGFALGSITFPSSIEGSILTVRKANDDSIWAMFSISSYTVGANFVFNVSPLSNVGSFSVNDSVYIDFRLGKFKISVFGNRF